MTPRILIAEDDRHTRSALQELLESEGYHVAAFGDGLSAADAIKQHAFDLLCLDVMMPIKSGFDLCRQVRQHDQRTPIIFITAKGEQIDKVIGFEIGADDYIAKPFGSHEVIARVKAVLRRCYPESSGTSHDECEVTQHPPFEMSDLRVIPSQMKAVRGEQTYDLTRREILILTMLFDANGDVVSRKDLYHRCWGTDKMPNSRSVDQTVSQLRKAIECDPKQPVIIQTVYGVGYRYPVAPA
ncbi:response regulator transcription factor [Crateriforma conspicua]|uniref:Alkaline phosphatase synthesis transcriptional regulatory protein PhoP n=1 Tax=Crateriforma conspicua TaxID=2527996 RepID=A0A5C5YH48_9PLAN|nr:response regulator transcription factor [Crateriforma conspicua]QDV61168.1 Alkaline phosphatase synthesis transcriptional regulatory protein PhoP [Crateriforma conspicua]TWT72582.1 Alkaline phosphatase synthesis transcriptional regulatory protein PhoP [Crateriforma conspicua]